MTLEADTTAHATSTSTGVEIKSGDGTRTLVGMVRTDGSSQFADFLTLSWFHRLWKSQTTAFTATRSTGSTTPFQEINTEIRNNFLVWTGEAVMTLPAGCLTNNTGADGTATSIGFDGTTAEDAFNMMFNPTALVTYEPFSTPFPKLGLSEGYHYATVIGYA